MRTYAEAGGEISSELDVTVRPMRQDEIEGVREVGQRAWSDLASRDLGRKVKYPLRPRRVLEAYLWKEPEGCIVAEREGRVAGSAFCHIWGKVGWVGPFEVLPELQNMGIGSSLMLACESYLEGRGCKVLGLETMPHVTKNIHFYLKLGYTSSGMTLISVKQLGQAVISCTQPPAQVQEATPSDLPELLPEISGLSARINPLLDYSRETEMAVRFGLGGCFAWRERGRLRGFSIMHSVHPLEESDHASIRLVAVDPRLRDGRRVFEGLMDACEARALELERKRAFIRYPADSLPLYSSLLQRSYRLEAANMRMARGPALRERGRYHLAAWAG